MTRTCYRLFPMLLMLAALQSFAQTDNGLDPELSVTVQKNAGVVTVDVDMPVAASRQDVWEVLTDYDNMAQFLPNLESSRVIARDGNRMQVEQTGKLTYGPFSFHFDSVREIELKPFEEVRSQVIGGSLRRGEAMTKLVPEKTGTRIIYHSESVPAVWVPPGIGPKAIESQTKAQFESLLSEILKRKRPDQATR